MGQKDGAKDWQTREVDLSFGPTSVAHPVIWEMARTHDVVFSLMEASVAEGEGRMRLKLSGPESTLQKAENFLRARGVGLKLIRSGPGKQPDAWPPQVESSWVGQKTIERKLWLTFRADQYERPLIWEMSRRFDTTFDIRQASVSGKFGIVGMLVKGPQAEVDNACQFLRDAGLTVEPIDRDVIEG